MIAFLTHDALPEADRVTVWLNNCCYQNKNYIHAAATNGYVQFDEVVFKYSVAGHSMMAADSYHRRMEGEFKEMQVVLSFRHITDAFRSTDKNCVTNTLLNNQFLAFPDDRFFSLLGKATTTISQICAVKFSRGSQKIMM